MIQGAWDMPPVTGQNRQRFVMRGICAKSQPQASGEAKIHKMFKDLEWLGNLDSNQDKQSQSLLCYRYTIPHLSR